MVHPDSLGAKCVRSPTKPNFSFWHEFPVLTLHQVRQLSGVKLPWPLRRRTGKS